MGTCAGLLPYCTSARFALILRTGRRSLVNRAARPESVKCTCKRDVVGNIRRLSILLSLHDHVSDVAATRDAPLVERRSLPGFPFKNNIAAFDRATLSQQWQRPGFVMTLPGFDCDHPLHRIDAVGHGAVLQSRTLTHCVVTNLWIWSD